MGREISSFDVETAATDPRHQAYGGLEPWRLAHRTVHITSASVCRPDNSVWSAHRQRMGDGAFEMALRDMVLWMAGRVVYAHFAVFDVAWVIGDIRGTRDGPIPPSVRAVKWYDTVLLTKWLVNGQKTDLAVAKKEFNFQLATIVLNFMGDHPLQQEFLRMKAEKVQPGMDPYWERRNEMDVIMTRAIAEKFEDKLPPNCRNGYSTEAKNIVPAANAWLKGIKVNQEKLQRVESAYDTEQKQIIADTKLSPSVITSPKQLSYLLFQQLGLKPESTTPTGNPSTAADDIKVIAYKLNQGGNEELGGLLNRIIRYKTIATLRSKYVNGCKNALSHTGDGYIYGAPRIFGTYTGRFTYSSKTLDEWQTSLALHQIPRKAKEIRDLLEPPDGYVVYEADSSGQESRLMATRAKDSNLIMIFNNGMDLHSMTASFILGMEYDDLHGLYKAGDKVAIENRQFGKLTNLSGNYRIGANALSKKAFEEYDLILTPDRTWYFLDVFKKRYRGIPIYWDQSIKLAKANGYAETFGGRRYKINDWSSGKTWVSESSALMLPIQGSGASQKNIAIAEIYENVPEADFALDLHDATFNWVPIETKDRIKRDLDEVLDNIDYSRYWGFVPPIKLPFESHMGNSFADVK